VTIDHESLEDEAVTVRDRDTWEQERIKVSELKDYLRKKLNI
jgi:glycyl-tRNA synthetase